MALITSDCPPAQNNTGCDACTDDTVRPAGASQCGCPAGHYDSWVGGGGGVAYSCNPYGESLVQLPANTWHADRADDDKQKAGAAGGPCTCCAGTAAVSIATRRTSSITSPSATSSSSGGAAQSEAIRATL